MSAYIDKRKVEETFKTEKPQKLTVLAIAIAITLATSYLAFSRVAAFMSWDNFPVMSFTFATIIWIFTANLKYYTVSVPEITGLVTISVLPGRFSGRLRAYPTGLYLKWPWEQAKEGNYINLRTMKTDTVKETYPTAAGPMLEATLSMQYEPEWPAVPQYISISEESINRGLIEVASSILREKIRTASEEEKDIEKLRTGKDELEKALMDHFRDPNVVKVGKDEQGNDVTVSREEYYGIKITVATVSDLDYDATYQRARSAKATVIQIKKAREEYKQGSDGTITDKDASDVALMLNGQNVTRTVSEVSHKLDATPAGQAALVATATALGAALAGARRQS